MSVDLGDHRHRPSAGPRSCTGWPWRSTRSTRVTHAPSRAGVRVGRETLARSPACPHSPTRRRTRPAVRQDRRRAYVVAHDATIPLRPPPGRPPGSPPVLTVRVDRPRAAVRRPAGSACRCGPWPRCEAAGRGARPPAPCHPGGEPRRSGPGCCRARPIPSPRGATGRAAARAARRRTRSAGPRVEVVRRPGRRRRLGRTATSAGEVLVLLDRLGRWPAAGSGLRRRAGAPAGRRAARRASTRRSERTRWPTSVVEDLPRSAVPAGARDLTTPLLRGGRPRRLRHRVRGRRHARSFPSATSSRSPTTSPSSRNRDPGGRTMPEYLTPGVYVEETSFRSRSIEGVPTSTFGMAGRHRVRPGAVPR